MKQLNELMKKISETIFLLNEIQEREWAFFFDNILKRYKGNNYEEVRKTTRELLKVFAGMGSFNDLVYYSKDFKKMNKINDQLNELKSGIYKNAVSIITSKSVQ